jgi:mannose-6-phosphate isomerase-like protein (cupin superfamily)
MSNAALSRQGTSMAKAITLVLGALVVPLGCQTPPAAQIPEIRLVAPDGVAPAVHWTPAELEQDIAIRTLGANESSSFHRVRARGAEKPHVHDRSDLVVVLLFGTVRAHVGNQVMDAKAGDVIHIPKGTPHWVENTGPQPSESLALFSPPFDGKDRRFIER